jgi:hypothetical protein
MKRLKRVRQNPVQHPIDFHLLKAVLAVQHRSLQDFCRPLPVTMRHAQFVLTGVRTGSVGLLAAIRHELGEPGWLFATGQTDTLRAVGADHAPR